MNQSTASVTGESLSLEEWREFLENRSGQYARDSLFVARRWVNPAALDGLAIFPKCFWKDRHGPRHVYAFGQVAGGSLETVRPHLLGTGLHAIGGRAFATCGVTPQSPWCGWQNDYFFVPAIEFHTQAGGTLIRRNFSPLVRDSDDYLSVLADAGVFESFWTDAGTPAPQASPPLAIARCDRPDFRGWSARVHSVLGELERDTLEKVVLARVSTLDLLEPAGAFSLLQRMEACNPHCYVFAISPAAGAGTFAGASPECLFRRNGSSLFTEAVAGTRNRSLDPTEDLRLARQLLDSPKERHEHGVVVDCLSAAMIGLCGENWNASEPEVLKLSRLQHLRSLFAGTLQNGCTDSQLLEVLHPTPATCGFPVARARQFLCDQEPFDRGWFAGPVGIVSENEAEFCVAIRSFHLRESEVDVYAGAGIVESCDPGREWAELESKIAGTLALFSAT